MATAAEILAKAKELLGKGEIAGASAVMQQTPTETPDTPAAATPAPPPEPRKFEEVALDCFTSIGNILGNHPVLAPLLSELHDIVSPAGSPAETK